MNLSYTLCFTHLLLVGCIVRASEFEGDNQVSKADHLAKDILDNIFKDRHAHMFAEIELELDLQIINDHHYLLDPGEGNRGNVQRKLDYLRDLESMVHLAKSTDTIAVLVTKNKVLVAGNLRTRNLPEDFMNDKMISQVTKKASENKRFNFDPKDYSDFGLQPQDSAGIKAAILKHADWVGNREVFVVKHVRNVDSAHWQEFRRKKEIVDNNYKTTKDQARQKGPVKRKIIEDIAENKRKKDMDGLNMRVRTSSASAYHAEIQLLIQIGNSGEMEKGELGVSKLPCERCREIIPLEWFQGRAPGLAKDRVTNFEGDFLITVDLEEISPIDKIGDTPRSIGGSKDIEEVASCPTTSRGRRSIAKCVFFKRGNNVVEIDAKNFLEVYGRSRNIEGWAPNSIVQQSGKLPQLIGAAEDVKMAKVILDNHMLKLHDTKVQASMKAVNTGEFDGVEPKNTRLSPSSAATYLAKLQTTEAFKWTYKGTGIFAKGLLAKTVVKGIINGDKTGLAILGGRVGGEVGLQQVGEYGAKSFSKVAAKKPGTFSTGAKITAKVFKGIAKAAAPLGAVFDVSMSSWNIANAARRLNDPSATKLEQKAAVADIVAESVEITITVVTLAAAIAFPPLAPAIFVVGFLSSMLVMATNHMYQTTLEKQREQEAYREALKHVGVLENQVQLFSEEREAEIERSMSGKHTSDYIMDIIAATENNNAHVASLVQKMGGLPEINRVFVASWSVPICSLFIAACKSGKNDVPDVAGEECTPWNGDWVTTASEYECYPDSTRCVCCNTNNTNMPTRTGMSECGRMEVVQCHCRLEKSQGPSLASDSFIDLRNVRDVHLERGRPDSPSIPGYGFTCLPSSWNYKGRQISEKAITSGYLCENALGVRRNDGGGNYSLFDLGDGRDVIFANDGSGQANRYHVGDGRKIIVGGDAEDRFYITGPCNDLVGWLDGGGGNNVLIVGDTCANGTTHFMDMATNPSFRVTNLQTFYGRRSQRDIVKFPCGFEYIFGLGGREGELDHLWLERGSTCSTQTTIMAESYSVMVVDAYPSAPSAVVIPEGTVNFVLVHRNPENGKSVVFMQYGSSSLKWAAWRDINAPVTLTIGNTAGDWVELRNPENFEIVLEEEDGLTSHLYVNEGKIICMHLLVEPSLVNITGCQPLPNVYVVGEGVSGIIVGGNDDDLFNVSVTFRGFISGRKGRNILILHNLGNVQGSVTIDLRNNRTLNNIKAEGIQEFIGVKHLQEIVTLGCSTSMVSTGGGTPGNLDTILLPQMDCYNPVPLTIHLNAYTAIENQRIAGSFTYIIHGMEGVDVRTLPSQVSQHDYIILEDLDILVSVSVGHGRVNLLFKHGRSMFLPLGKCDNETGTYKSPGVQVQTEGGNLMALYMFKEYPTVVASFEIRRDVGLVRGLSGIPNRFVVDTLHDGWQYIPRNDTGIIEGGQMDDTFILKSLLYQVAINGGGGSNQLQVDDTFLPGSNFIFDLRDNGTICFSDNSTIVSGIMNLQRISGRGIVNPSCETQFLKGFEKVVVSPVGCLGNRSLDIYLGSDTEVGFLDPEYPVGPNHKGTFHYIFQSNRSFEISVFMWLDIRDTRQVYHLPQDLLDLQEIFCLEDEGTIQLVTSSDTYTYPYDTYFSDFQQFHGNPELRTKDGFQIRIDRYGDILVAAGNLDWFEYEDDELATVYGSLASKLEVTMLLHEDDDRERFIYAGYYGATNILTTTDRKSLLLGGGGNKTTYVILDLQQDVKVYPGFLEDEGTPIFHTLDLTHVIFQIRNLSDATRKYVPAVKETEEGHIEISMDGHKHLFPATVTLINGTRYAKQIQILLESVAMTLHFTPRVRRDDSSSRKVWEMKPTPFYIQEDEVTVMTLMDFEIGQQIILVQGNETTVLHNNGPDSQHFQPYQDGRALIISNIEGGDKASLKSLVITDLFAANTKRVAKEVAETLEVKVTQGSGERFENLVKVYTTDAPEGKPQNWLSALAKIEEEMIAEVPLLPGVYSIPSNNIQISGVIIGLLIVALALATCVLVIRRRRWIYVLLVNVDEAKHKGTNEACDIPWRVSEVPDGLVVQYKAGNTDDSE